MSGLLACVGVVSEHHVALVSALATDSLQPILLHGSKVC